MAKRILIADDEVHIRKILSLAFTKAGYEVVSCQDGKEAIAAIEKGAIDLVITDLMMPEVNGYEVIERLKRDKGTRDIPAIVLTALGQNDDLLKAKEAGADLVITKPFSPKKIVEMVEAMLKQ